MNKHHNLIEAPNKAMLAGEWNTLKGKIKQKWGKLTDDDMTMVKGNVDELVGRVQKAYGYSKERAIEEFNQFKQNVFEKSASAKKSDDETDSERGSAI